MYQRCRQSWIERNPDWTVISLDSGNLSKYINISQYVDVDKKIMTLTKRSNIARLMLLKQYGGLWVDASIYCYQSLDDWLPTEKGFFAFDKPGPGRPLSNWLIYAERDNYLLNTPASHYFNWWRDNDNDLNHNYFIFHHLFDELLKTNKHFNELWLEIPKISAIPPHSV